MSLFIEKARLEGKNSILRYVLGFLISFVGGQFIGAIPLLMIMVSKGQLGNFAFDNPAALGVSNNTFLILMLLPFVVNFILLWVCIRFLHGKRFIVSLTAFSFFDWKKMFFAFFLWLMISVGIEVCSYIINPSNYVFQYSGSSFWILLLIACTLIPIQTTFEELLFRSYLMQGIGIHFAYRMVPFLITSVLFGLMHIANPEIKEYGYIILISYIGIGFLLGLLTILSDSTEFAIGLHAANNIYSATLVGFKSSALPTDTLFYTKVMRVDLFSFLIFFAAMIIFYVIVHRKYKLLPITSLWENQKHNC